MILRKPYALLIKNFKIIHVIIGLMILFMYLKSGAILNFLNDYLINSGFILESYKYNEIYSSSYIIVSVLIIIFNIIILFILKMKDKKVTFYIYNIIVYSLFILLLTYTSSVFNSMQNKIVDLRVIKALKDFFFAYNVIQIISLFMYIMRATGFDVKKFNFKKDLVDLKVEEKDSEEFEVNINVDLNKISRNRKKGIRYLKYFYFENRFISNIVISVVCFIIVFFGILGIINRDPVYKQYKMFTTNFYTLQVEEVYTTTLSKDNKVIDDNYAFILMKIKLKKNSTKSITLNTGRFELKTGDSTYHSTNKYNNYFEDIGSLYRDDELKSEFTTYFLIYRINKKDANKKFYLNYINDTNDIRVNIKTTSLDNENTITGNFDESLAFDNSIVDDYSLTLERFQLDEKIKVNYKYCITDTKCNNAYEYVTPGINANFDKAVLRLDGTLIIPEFYNEYVTSMESLIKKFGYLSYEINGKTYISSFYDILKANKVKQDTTTYYEVKKDVLSASKIMLVLKIRNNTYNYILKDGGAEWKNY